jgi:hypothetical protein
MFLSLWWPFQEDTGSLSLVAHFFNFVSLYHVLSLTRKLVPLDFHHQFLSSARDPILIIEIFRAICRMLILLDMLFKDFSIDVSA